MNEAEVQALARRVGIAVDWRDHANRPHRVSSESLGRILAALGLPCGTAAELADSQHALDAGAPPPLVTATVGAPIDVPAVASSDLNRVSVKREDGALVELSARLGPRGVQLPGVETPGYYTVLVGDQETTLAVAPPRCMTVGDLAPHERVFGLVAQIHGLRRTGDCGIGDMTGVSALATNAAAQNADLLALSPTHALFAAAPAHFSPYSPSNRLFYNSLHADPRMLFGDERVQRAVCDSGLVTRARELEQQLLIDWPESTRIKMSIFRRLFDDFSSNELAATPPTALAVDFAAFRASGGTLLEDHARFEALHADRLKATGTWNWSDWPAQWSDPASGDVKRFAERNENEVAFHCFLQWIADRSLAAAQQQAKQAGMRIGLLADLAVGMSGAGSHAWTSQRDILVGLQVGAPPDLYNAKGQNWGLTTFSPRALIAGGFAPFIATLRACLRHAGGIRVDHAMGLLRLWVIPDGLEPEEGAYLSYPLDDLLRLTALESYRHRAIVIGEDLGTVPAGFRERLATSGIYGMRVLWFERARNHFTPPHAWPAETTAMTSTHDLPTIAGWWCGGDIAMRGQIGLVADPDREQLDRADDRKLLWRAFRRAGAAAGAPPPPTETAPVADAAVKFIAQTSSDLALLPLEDALALAEQPNLPGTIDQHPNWRRRYVDESAKLLEPLEVRQRLASLSGRARQ